MRSRKLIWAARSRDGAEQKGTELGESEAHTVLAASGYLLTVSSNSTDLWAGWTSILPYLSFLLRIPVNLVNYCTGESKALHPRQSPAAGKWCKLPTSHQPRSANPPLLWPVKIPSLPQGHCPEASRPQASWLGPTVQRKVLPRGEECFCFEKVFNEKVNAFLFKK